MKVLMTLFVLLAPLCYSTFVQAQPTPEIHIDGNTNIDAEISQLMNELNLTDEQKITVGILIFKYGMEFDYRKFEDASNSKKYKMANSKIKELDKDLKSVLNKEQFKVYKKRKKSIKKELLKSA